MEIEEIIQRSYRGGKNVYYLLVFQEAKIINQLRFKKKEKNGILTILLSPFVLQICDERGDKLADKARVRIQGALSDLHAADARQLDA